MQDAKDDLTLDQFVKEVNLPRLIQKAHEPAEGVKQFHCELADGDRRAFFRLRAQYFNAVHGRTGHLWQNRFFSCALDARHLWRAICYVERNPVRAGLVDFAELYRWSSAAAHTGGSDDSGVLDLDWWREQRAGSDWREVLRADDADTSGQLRRCTYSGKPFGGEDFLAVISEQFGRSWKLGRPSKAHTPAAESAVAVGQLSLF